jgi:hypothetical protein
MDLSGELWIGVDLEMRDATLPHICYWNGILGMPLMDDVDVKRRSAVCC